METDFLAAVLVTGCGQTAGPTVRLNAVWLYVSEFRREIEATGLLNVVFCSPVAGSVRVTGADRLLSAVQNPVEGVGFEQIQGATSDQQIASGAAIQSIASGSAIQSVVTESSEDAVIAIATAEEIAT